MDTRDLAVSRFEAIEGLLIHAQTLARHYHIAVTNNVPNVDLPNLGEFHVVTEMAFTLMGDDDDSLGALRERILNRAARD